VTISHSQFVNCIRGIRLTGSGSGSGSGSGTAVPLTVNNTLMANVQYPFTVNTPVPGNVVRHVTIHTSTNLVTATASASLGIVNSIFANVATNVSGSASLSGNYNGFHAASQFGSNQQSDESHPFATDEGTIETIALAQGRYYLRQGSPFIDVGLGWIPSALRAELEQRATIEPALFVNDVHTTQTLRRTLVRDSNILNLGYHYPAVDYIVSIATVNDATLFIEPGTVLAFTSPFSAQPNFLPDWGIRLNPGGRLVVNGHPTNRVVFTRLEAIQEDPVSMWQWGGPLFTFKGLVFDGAFATPLPELVLRYADVLNVSGPNNYDLGDLYLDTSYNLVARIELDGCHFRGGDLYYESGGPEGRSLFCRNTVFERAGLILANLGNHHGAFEEQMTFHNNLFYRSWMAFLPVNGANWTFIDNIFDSVIFAEDAQGTIYNGPVGVNHHNAGSCRIRRRAAAPAATSFTGPNLRPSRNVTKGSSAGSFRKSQYSRRSMR
jgi:hypothetical protein